VLPKEIAADLTLMNLHKTVSKADLKKQYHKLAKQYHPDVIASRIEQATEMEAIN
jgi:DnaJ-class molecular chaperone